MGKLARVWLFSALTALACVDKGTSGPKVEGGGDSPSDSTVCATCQMRAGGETADFGASSGEGGGTTTCGSAEAPLTEQVEEAFELDQLRAFLARPRVVEAEPRGIPEGQPNLNGPIELEFQFELGEFKYRKGTDPSRGSSCDTVWAPVELTANVGDGLLSFHASGGMYKQAGKLHAFMYTSADLATATGSYRPHVDTNRLHVGQIEVPLYVYADQLRGEVLPELIYFQNEEHLTSWLEHRPSPVPGVLPDFQTLVHLDFPADACTDSQLPLTAEDGLDLLGGKSPTELRSDVFSRAETHRTELAVWRDGRETTVQVDIAEAPAANVCAEVNDAPYNTSSSGSELQYTMPAMATLRTDDGKIDVLLDKVTIVIGREDARLRRAVLHTSRSGVSGQKFDARIDYSFASGTVTVNGIVHFLNEVSPGAGTYGDCVAFPPGGQSDTGDCRYVRRL